MDTKLIVDGMGIYLLASAVYTGAYVGTNKLMDHLGIGKPEEEESERVGDGKDGKRKEDRCER